MKRDLALAAAGLVLVATAAIPLHRVFTTTEWRPGVAAAALIATVLAVVARRLRLPGAVVLPLSLLGLLVFAARVHAVEAGPWPTPDALHELWQLARQGFEDIRMEPAPARPLDGIRVLLTGGTWVVAHVTHEALVRLRRPGVALVTTGLLWFSPLAVPMPGTAAWPNALPFFVAGGMVLLLEPDPDGSGWTREETGIRLPAGGMALAGVAAVLGLLAPLLSPGYAAPAWVDVTAATEPRGYQPIVDVGDRLHLPQPRDVLEVQSPQRVYLRLAALDTFDGRTWRLGPPDVETFRPEPDQLFRADGELPFETPIAAGTRTSVSVEVLDLENIYVPVPYQIATIDGPEDAGLFYSLQGGFVATGNVGENELSGETRVGVQEGFRYEAEAVLPSPSFEDLAALGRVSLPPGDPRIALPGEYSELGNLTRQIGQQAGAETTIETVLAVQDHFIGSDSEYTYSTDVPELRGDAALRDFVFDTQTGYCEYFATAMAVMLRAADIPARVSVGFLPGEVTQRAPAPGEPATFTVSTTDAHAWVEVFFDGYGWVRMDPTPRGDAVPATASDLTPQAPLAEPTAEPTTSPTSQPTTSATVPEQMRPEALDEGGGAGDVGSTAGTGPGGGLVVVLVVLLLGALAAAWVYARPQLHRLLARPRADTTAEVLGAQRRVLFTAAHLGLGRADDETVTEVATRWAAAGRVDPADAAAFARLGSQAAFGTGLDAEDAATMHALEDRMVDDLRRSVDRRQRVTAPWRHAGQELVEALGRGQE